MSTLDLTPSTRFTFRPCPSLKDTHEVLIERDIGMSNGDRQKTQLFLSAEELHALQKLIVSYNADILNF